MIRKIQANKPENKAYAIPNLTYNKCTKYLTCKREMSIKNKTKLHCLLALGDVDSLLGNWLVGCSANFLGEWWSREAAFLQAHCWHIGTDIIHTCTRVLLFNFFEPILFLSHTSLKIQWQVKGNCT